MLEKNKIINNIITNTNEIAKFFKFNRSNIKKIIIDDLNNLDIEMKRIDEEHINLERSKNILKENLLLKSQEYENLNKEKKQIQEKYNLVANLLNSKPLINEKLNEFIKLCNEDFIEFANEESSLAEEAEMIIKLQNIEKEVRLICEFPELYTKNIIAIGGGFSSGKSSFINSFFKDDELILPVGINPVTAIPGYVIYDTTCVIKGYSNTGGIITIENNFYKKMSHDFLKTFDFNLKEIMPFISINIPMDKHLFKNICLIDTPGYNPSLNGNFTQEDKSLSLEYLEESNSLIWVIGIDSNGTIPKSDLEFLEDFSETKKKIFILLNKGDLKSKNQQDEILNEVAEVLEDYNIKYEGISIFSSIQKREYVFKNKSIFEFIRYENVENTKTYEIISKKLNSIFDKYYKAILDEKNHREKIFSILKSLRLDLMEINYDFDDDKNKIISRIDDIKRDNVDIKHFEEQIEKLFVLRKKMNKSLERIFIDFNGSITLNTDKIPERSGIWPWFNSKLLGKGTGVS